MPSQIQLRRALRWGHLAAGVFVGTYICSPLHLDPLWTDLGRYVVVPTMILSGLWMWQQGRVARWARPARTAPSRP